MRHRMQAYHDDAMEASRLIASFGRYVDNREATILVGAGLSREAGYPDWPGLLEKVRDALGRPDLKDLPLLAQYYTREFSEGDLQHLIRQELKRDPLPQPTRCHDLLAALPLAEIWTTNYDDLIERAMADGARTFVSDDDLARADGSMGCRVYKMHGSLTHPDQELIIARDQYIRYPDSHKRFWALLQASFLTKSFLFLGFSFEDPNFDQVFQAIRRARYGIHREHFAVLREPSGEQEKILFRLRLKDLEAIGINVAAIDEYSQLEVLLKQLIARCRPCRLFIAGSPPEEKPDVGDSYPSIDLPEPMSDFADQLGAAFEETSVALSAGGAFGARVGYALLRRLQETGGLHAERFMLLRRSKDQPLDEPSQRLGSIVFQGSDEHELRDAAFGGARAVLAIGGGSGTADEIMRAQQDGLGVVPIGKFGGSALQEWTRISESLEDYRLGGLPVDRADFNSLRYGGPQECSRAAARLSKQALYIPQGG